MSSDELLRFLELRRVDAFELKEPLSIYDSLFAAQHWSHPLLKNEEYWFLVRSPGAHGRVALRHWLTRGAARTRRRYVEPSKRLTSPPCVCSSGINHMLNVRQAPVPSEPWYCVLYCSCSCVSQSSRSPCHGLRRPRRRSASGRRSASSSSGSHSRDAPPSSRPTSPAVSTKIYQLRSVMADFSLLTNA